MRDAVEAALDAAVVALDPLDGGEVGAVYRADLADGRTVVAKTSPTPLEVEADMLEFLGERGLPVPGVVHRGDDLLVLAYVDGDGALTDRARRDVARRLAALHDETGRAFGFPFDTRNGVYRQPNPWTDSWVAFYRDRRLLYAAERARDEGVLTDDLFARVAALAGDLDALLPDDPPASLLHGDVWAGNVVVADGSVRAFLDPACYFGHAEVELAYVDFVGSFGDPFFETYRETRGIDDGFFEERRHVYRLYPLLIHLLYFGDDRYAAGVAEALDAVGR